MRKPRCRTGVLGGLDYSQRGTGLMDREQRRYSRTLFERSVGKTGHKFGHSLGIRNCCPVCRAPIYEAPIRDNTYKMELSDAVREGLVEPSASDTPEKLYDWDRVVFATD
ncbi:hypothetical protein C8J57DRAFT_1240167 [Mycena rebaudengoi]|nr:hypothetical protein C8J57DRAFT_1240167 [Mycena rebaudengoi]